MVVLTSSNPILVPRPPTPEDNHSFRNIYIKDVAYVYTPSQKGYKHIGSFYMMNPFDAFIYSAYLTGIEQNMCFFFGNMSFTSIRDKWKAYDSVLNNMFLTIEKREELMGILSKIQRMIHGFYRFKHIWRFHKAKTYNTDDLFMNPISSKDGSTITLFENNTKYIFQIRECVRMVHSSLSNCCHFFPNPVPCKNPYTNLPIHKSNLYNIYFAIRGSGYRMPPLLEAFFREDFHLKRFLVKNELLINTEYLKTYVENNCLESVLDHVKDMFKDHNIRCRIHPNFPRNRLYEIMKPYLSLYFESDYSFDDQKKGRAYQTLHNKLHVFQMHNNGFGRRKVQIVSKNPFSTFKQCIYVFDDNHPPFHQPISKPFLTSHLESNADSPDLITHTARLTGHFVYHDDDTEDDDEDDDEDEDDTIAEEDVIAEAEDDTDDDEDDD